MKEFNYTITDPEGIHARPAGELVKVCKEFSSKITLIKDGKSGDCKKIFGIMALAVSLFGAEGLPVGANQIRGKALQRGKEKMFRLSK